MTIEYDNNAESMDMWCDTCDESGTISGEFMDCINSFKDDGWRIYNEGNADYTHTCPDCVEKEKTLEHDKL